MAKRKLSSPKYSWKHIDGACIFGVVEVSARNHVTLIMSSSDAEPVAHLLKTLRKRNDGSDYRMYEFDIGSEI